MAYFDKYGVEFSDDRKTLVKCPKVFKGEYIIPNNVTSIEHNAFYKCIGLTAVTIPDSVTSIGDGAFWDCSNLTSVTIPNSVTYIGYSAFQGCNCLMSVHINDIAAWCAISFMNSSDTGYGHSNPSFCHSNPLFYAYNLYLNDELITDLTIPNSVKSIGDNAFYGCSCLTSVKIPDSVKYIGEGAFAGCWGLTSVTIPKSVTYIGNYAFYGCSGLTSVHINDIAAWSALSFNSQPLHYAHNLYLNDELITNLTIPNSVKSIGDGAFAGCSCLTSVTIPNSVTSIGGSAFEGCSGLTSVTIPNSVSPALERVLSPVAEILKKFLCHLDKRNVSVKWKG